MAIATLAYKIVADTKSLTAGMDLTRREVSLVKKVFEETRTPAERLQHQLDALEKLFKKGLDADIYARAVKKVKDEFAATQPAVESMFGAFVKGGLAMTAVHEGINLVKTGVRSMVTNVKQQFGELDAISHLSQRLGIAPEQLVGMQLFAGRSDVDTGSLTTGLEKMTKFIGQAQLGNKEAAGFFGTLKLNASTLALKPVQDQFTAIVGAISSANTETEKMAMATKVFGLAGADLVPVLSLTKKELAGAVKEAQELGLAFTAEQLSGIDAADESIKRLTASWQALGRTIAVEVSPHIVSLQKILSTDMSDESWGQWLKDWVMAGGTFAAGKTVTSFIQTSETNKEISRTVAETERIKKRTEEKRKKRDLAELGGETNVYAADFAAEMEASSQRIGEEIAADKLRQMKITADFAAEMEASSQRIGGEITATASMQMAIAAMFAVPTAAKEASAEQKKVWQEANAIISRFERPADAAARELRDLDRLRSEGMISEDLFKRAGMDLATKAFGARETGANVAISRGSAEAIRLEQGQKDKTREITLAEQQLIQLKKIAGLVAPERIEEVDIL